MIKDLEELQDQLHEIQDNSKYRYTNALHSRYGIMICSVCGGGITGQYRNEETPETNINTHRDCCADDPYWLASDAVQSKRLEIKSSIEKDINEMKEKYGHMFDNTVSEYCGYYDLY